MRTENGILALLKEKPLLMTKLQEELQLSTEGMVGVMSFLVQYKLVETMASTEHELMAKITEKGLQLLNLPDLPEEESANTNDAMVQQFEAEHENKENVNLEMMMGIKNNLTYLLGRGEGTITINQLNDKFILTAYIPKRAERLKLQSDDISKCYHLSEQRGFSEATINSIKAREDERQQEIAGVKK